MIPTGHLAHGMDPDSQQLRRHIFRLPHQQELSQSKDPVMLTLRGNPESSSFKPTDQQSLLATSLNQFSGKINISATQLIQALDAAYHSSNAAKNAANAGGMTAETMDWDEFDIDGNDMMQRVYEDRLKKAQELDASNNKPTTSNNTKVPVAPKQKQQEPQQRGPGIQRPAIDIDSDDSDFGEQIKAQKKKQKSTQQTTQMGGMKVNPALQQSQQYRRASTIPIGGTLPAGMTILDLSSSDDDNVTSKQNTKTNDRPRFSHTGPKIVTMSLKPDQATPLSMSLANDLGQAALFGRPQLFDDLVIEEEEDDDDDDQSDEFASPLPQANKQLNKPSPRPAVPPPETPSSSNLHAGDTTPTNIQRPPRPTIGGRMSLWEKAKSNAITTTTTTATTTPAAAANTSTIGPVAAPTTSAIGAARPVISQPAAIPEEKKASTTAPATSSTSSLKEKPIKEKLIFGFQDVTPGSIKANSPQQSKLTQELNDSGFLRNAKRSKDLNPRQSMLIPQGRSGPPSKRSGPSKTIGIRFKFSTKPLPVHVYNDMCVDELIQACLEAYQQARREPPLQSVLSLDYHLHVWDEDENGIDTDIPPFNRSQIVSKLDTASLCLAPDKNIGTRKPQQEDDEYDSDFGEYRPTMASPTSANNNMNDRNNILMTEPVTPRNKSNTVLQSPNNPVEHDQSDTYEHHNQIQASEDTLTTLDSLSTYIHQLYSQMTHVTAGKATEYKVFKINTKGKRQERYFGLDRFNIYNKTTPSSKFNTFSKLMNISKTERPIKSIIHVRVLPESLTTFQISYKEDGSDTVTSRGYEVESVMTCAEIVAKLRYLINNP